jgi:dipicolinate synthase subunit A
MYEDDATHMYEVDDSGDSEALTGVTAAVVGGDGREVEYLRGLRADGAEVRACGLPPEAEDVMGHPQADTPEAAIDGADAVFTTVVHITEEGELYTPGWDGQIYQDAFANIDPGGTLFIGTSTPETEGYAEEGGFDVVEYGDDDELMYLRAPTIIEGVLGITIDHTDVSIHDSQSVVLGFGRMGFSMTRTLEALGAHTTVVARDGAQLARAREMGARPVHLDDLAEAVSAADMVFNTIPTAVLTRDVLEGMPRDAFVLDLASTPGGTDFDAAEELGIDAVLAPGLGGRAPKTAGRYQWMGLRRMLLEDLGRAE